MTTTKELPHVEAKPVKYSRNPLKKGSAFVLHGCVFQVYEVKTKGRMLIRFLGEVIEEEKDSG